MAKTKRVSERLRELKEIEKRIQQNLLCEIAKTAVKNYNPKTKTIDTRELVEMISGNWDFLAKKFKSRTKREVTEHEG